MSKHSTRGFACLAWLAAIALILPAWAPPAAAASNCTIAPDEPAVTGIFVQPDDGYRPLIDEFNAARCTIDLNVYLLADPVIVESLVAAHVRGVKVRVQIEEHPFGGSFESTDRTIARLEQADIEWRYTPDHFRFSHAKYAVVDRAVGIVMNLNLTPAAFSRNREFGAVTTDQAIVRDLQAVFEVDWTGKEADFGASSVMVGPDNSRAMLLSAIAQASATIDMYAEVVRDDEVVTALIAAASRGVMVRMIVDPSLDDLDFAVYSQLSEGGVQVASISHVYVHAKALVVDNTVAIVGSHNPTSTSLDDNREVSLIVGDPYGVSRVVRTFAMDWSRARPIFP